MEDWIIWVIVAVACIAVEITTKTFVTLYFGVAAALVAALSLTGAGPVLQVLAFAALSVGSLALTRPWLMRVAGASGPAIPSGVDAMRGRIGTVTKAIGDLDPGLVRIGGEVWTARSYLDEPIAEGSRIEVVQIEGVTAMVVPVPSIHDELPKEI